MFDVADLPEPTFGNCVLKAEWLGLSVLWNYTCRPTLLIYTDRMPFMVPNQQCQSTQKMIAIGPTGVEGEVLCWLWAENVEDVVDGVDRHSSRVELHFISSGKEFFPWRVEPQFVVDLSLFLRFAVRALAQFAEIKLLFL